MFLRFNRRFKDGKEHRYWNIVENARCVMKLGLATSKPFTKTLATARSSFCFRPIGRFPNTRRRTVYKCDSTLNLHWPRQCVACALKAMS
jgi:hypothetical protein